MVGLIAPKLNQQRTQPTLHMNALNTGTSTPTTPPPSPRGTWNAVFIVRTNQMFSIHIAPRNL